jgi:toxin ParE1/3/4
VAPILGYACRIALPRSKAAVTPVVWTFSALADLEGIRRYIGNFNPYAARDMADRIIEAGNSLANFPYRGRQIPGTQLRESAISRPYIIRYRVDADRVVILRVRHDARRPPRP